MPTSSKSRASSCTLGIRFSASIRAKSSQHAPGIFPTRSQKAPQWALGAPPRNKPSEGPGRPPPSHGPEIGSKRIYGKGSGGSRQPPGKRRCAASPNVSKSFSMSFNVSHYFPEVPNALTTRVCSIATFFRSTVANVTQGRSALKTNAILYKRSPDLWLEARAFDDTSHKRLGHSHMCPWIALRSVTGTPKRGSHTVPLFAATSCNQQFVTQACCKKGYRISTPVCGTRGLAWAAPVRHAPLPPTMAFNS